MPRGVIELERLFDQDVIQGNRPREHINAKEIDKVNLGTEQLPRYILLGKTCVGKQRERIVNACKEYVDVIAWTYEELKTYDPNIITHTILLKAGARPFRQKQRVVNALLEPMIEQEIQKLVQSKIIFPIRHSTWVANVIPVRKKSREIRVCIEFRHLNRASKKDNYPLPSLDEVLQIVNGSQMMSFLDGYSEYNQVMVDEEDRLKIAFTTKWGTFAYSRMPFGLINAGATFQRAMDFAFKGLVGKSIIIYMDDLIVYSKDVDDHPQHLRQIFQRCKEFGISLNPKKCIFGVTKG